MCIVCFDENSELSIFDTAILTEKNLPLTLGD